MSSLDLAELVRHLCRSARRAGYGAPSFRTRPPGRGGRTIRRRDDGSATVAVVIRDRPFGAVVADVIDGIVAANRLEVAEAATLRDLLWACLDARVEMVVPGPVPDTTPAAAVIGVAA